MNPWKVGSGERKESINGDYRQQRLSLEQACLPTPHPLSHVFGFFFFFFLINPFVIASLLLKHLCLLQGDMGEILAMALLPWAAGDPREAGCSLIRHIPTSSPSPSPQGKKPKR